MELSLSASRLLSFRDSRYLFMFISRLIYMKRYRESLKESNLLAEREMCIRDRGKYTARERIAMLLDEGSLAEMDMFVDCLLYTSYL